MNNAIKEVARTKEEAKDNYDRMSGWYDWIVGASEKKYRNLGLQALAARQGEQILEIGFGTGHAIVSLAQAVGPEGHVYGLDISEGMLAVTQKRVRQAGLAKQVTLQVGDGAQLPFGHGRFDAVFMSFTLELFDTPEIPLVLQQVRATLRPNGRFVVVSLAKEPKTAVRIYEWFHDKMPIVVDCRPIYAQNELEKAGFIIQSHSRLSMWGLPVAVILARRLL
jgi:ubiquinone/menaquinone biosynthesis C-methylase UbiE